MSCVKEANGIMERYEICGTRTDFGWRLECPAFGIGVDELDGAVDALKALVEREAMVRLDRGDFLPASEALEPGSDRVVMYVDTDFQNQFVAKSETVRRNVSVPSWIDVRLRRNNIDASRLFQDAALAKLAELEATGRGLRRISDLSMLQDACTEEVLDEYFRRRMERVLRDGMDCARKERT